ncbi:MAG TPA: mechanosensitive ion channel family protein [Ardenticatenaceae bacterium]|nr:mechanosensitive ion channel family protein [Ardenticatenaceae bacterium]
MSSLNSFYVTLRVLAEQYLARLILRIPTFVLGLLAALFFLWLARWVRRRFYAFCERRAWPAEIELLLSQTIYVAILVTGLVAVLGIWGLNVTGLVAGLGIVGVATGFALQQILANFIAGVLLLIQRPFALGDQIKSGEFQGEVSAVTLRATLLRTSDNREIIIPNATIYTSSIVNLTRYRQRRTGLPLTLGGGHDLDEARRAILETVRAVEGVLREPSPDLVATGSDESGTAFELQYWTDSAPAVVNATGARVVAALQKLVRPPGAEGQALRAVKIGPRI